MEENIKVSRKSERVKVKKTNKTGTNKKAKNMGPQVSIFTVLFVAAIIAVIVFAYIGIRYLVINLTYKKYTDKVYDYGYNVLYNNEKATATQKVTNVEIVKLILGVTQNTTDISNIYTVGNNQDTSDAWLNYADSLGLVQKEKITANKEVPTKADAAIIATKLIEAMFEEEITKTELKASEKVLAKYTADEKDYLSKAVTLGLIKNKKSSFKDKQIIKGELNKIVAKIIEEYKTVYYKTLALSKEERSNVNIITDKKKMPENYKEYPYIVDNIPNEIYELDYNVITEYNFKTPKQAHERMGHLYMQIDELITDYMNKILNIDYTTISVENFLQDVNPYVAYRLDEADVKTYVDYVKTNKIKLEGKATPLLPIMYNNGEQYLIRTKIDLKVVNSETKYNLLFGDENSNVTYEGETITVYIDVPTGMTLNAMSLRIYVAPLAEYIAQPNTQVVIEKIGG